MSSTSKKILVVEQHEKGLAVSVPCPEALSEVRHALVAAVVDVAYRAAVEGATGKASELERAELALLTWRVASGDTLVVANPNAYEAPGAWGIVIADLVGHVANAYVSEGFDPVAVRKEILFYLHAELNDPTAKPEQIGEMS